MAASCAMSMAMLFLFLLTAQATDDAHKGNDGDLVAQVCRTIPSLTINGTQDPIFDITQGLCESELRSDRRSAVAKSPRDLTLIAIDLLQRAATDALPKIDEQLSHTKNQADSTCLRYCRLDYTTILDTAPLCRSLVQAYNPTTPIMENNFECINKLVSAAQDCKEHVANLNKNALWSEVYSRSALVDALMAILIPTDNE